MTNPQVPPRSGDVPSPCINVCRLDAEQVCVGCGRRIEEIVEWPTAGQRRKLEIVARAARRRAERVPPLE